MENLNAEMIKKALECCANAYDCFTCDIYKRQCIGGFRTNIAQNALALITSQEQRIKELTEENERLSGAVKQYEDERKYHFEMSRTRISEAKADTVRKMQESITEHATNDYPRKVRLDVIDQIAQEMIGEIK